MDIKMTIDNANYLCKALKDATEIEQDMLYESSYLIIENLLKVIRWYDDNQRRLIKALVKRK